MTKALLSSTSKKKNEQKIEVNARNDKRNEMPNNDQSFDNSPTMTEAKFFDARIFRA